MSVKVGYPEGEGLLSASKASNNPEVVGGNLLQTSGEYVMWEGSGKTQVDPNTNAPIAYRASVKSGVLMVLPSSGSVGNNGALSGLTAFPAALGDAFLYFPASALYAGSVAGFYYTILSSTTGGTVYNDRWQGGLPTYPSNPTPIVATGPGAYTQATNVDITAASFVVPGGALGPNGSLFVYPNIGANNTGGTKAWTVKYANNTLIGKSNTTATMDNTPVTMRNAGRIDRQVSTAFTGFNANSGANFITTSVDSSLDQEVIITLKILTATDYTFLRGFDAVLSF